MSTHDWIQVLTVPIFTAVIGWLINWTGLIMLFQPVHFHGIRVPGLQELSTLLPRRLQEVPGIMQGGLGWQGIVPSRAAKMGSISVDKAISKLGSPSEFYEQLEPEKMADHIVKVFDPEIPAIVERNIRREHPDLWQNLPARAREVIVERVRRQLPDIVRNITDEVGENIDQLLDPKLMVVDHFAQHPELVNRIFRDIGRNELKWMVRFGFIFGFLFGIPVAAITHFVPWWWLLPVLGVIVGWTTNLLGMYVIFQPVEGKKIGRWCWQGLFLKRQNEVAEIYGRLIADEVITLRNIGNFLLDGPSGDRTRQMLEEAMGPAIDRAAGPAQPAVRVAVGAREYDSIRDSVALEAADHTLTGFQDPEFSRQQAERMRELVSERTKELPAQDYVEMLRSAIKEDEWMLYAHGAVLGLVGGFLHLAFFG